MVGYVNGALLNATNRQSLFAALRTVSVVFTVLLSMYLAPQYKAIGISIAVASAALVDFVLYSVLCHHYLHLTFPVITGFKIALSTAMMAGLGYLALRSGIGFVVVILLCATVYGWLLFVLRVVTDDEWQFIANLAPLRRIRILRPL
jgi:O-antigen/teichoic acid export membrane protein